MEALNTYVQIIIDASSNNCLPLFDGDSDREMSYGDYVEIASVFISKQSGFCMDHEAPTGKITWTKSVWLRVSYCIGDIRLFTLDDSNSKSHNGFKFDSEIIQMARPNYDAMFKNSMSDEIKDAISEANRHRIQAQQAQIDAAHDIADMKGQMRDSIDNQRIQIENQIQQIERQEKTIDQLQELNESQRLELKRLKEILVSIENGTAADEQMMRDIQELLSKQLGWKDFIADKGADVVIGGLLTALPHILRMIGLTV